MTDMHPLAEWRQKQQELINHNKKEIKKDFKVTFSPDFLNEPTPKSKGLGDTIEEVFKKTGISYIAKKALGEDCGCDKRKKKLNKIFPYKDKK